MTPGPYRGRIPWLVLLVAAAPAVARAAPWQLDPQRALPPGGGDVTQKVEVVDLDADGFVDLVFANSKGDKTGGLADAQPLRVVRNLGGQQFVADANFPEVVENGYAVKAGDLDRDGDPDLVVGTNFSGVSYLLWNQGDFFAVQEVIPGLASSIGDLELGDIDGDAILDVVAVDWGTTQPYGEPGDPGGPLRIWRNTGFGEFFDGEFLVPMGTFTTWSNDVELMDLDNDWDLDIVITSRAPGEARVLLNDGAGNFSLHPVPSLAPLHESAFTVVDLDDDLNYDLVALQAGPNGADTVLVSDGAGQFINNKGAYWALVDNPKRNDFDAATLDFDNNATPDLVVVGPRINPGEVNARLLLNDGVSLIPLPPDAAAFPVVPELEHAFGLQLADLDNDRRIDAVVAVRDELGDNQILFGASTPGDEVPVDTVPPHIEQQQGLPDVLGYPGFTVVRARVHDGRTPARWHDFMHDPQIDVVNFAPGAITAHRRRLPYLELGIGFNDPGLLGLLADNDPQKLTVQGEWSGEALWSFAFEIPAPVNDLLHWRLCAVDAAGNKNCTSTSTATYVHERACGDGVVQPWEECDDANDPQCVACMLTCGDCFCDPAETADNCPEDCSGECGFDTGDLCGDAICQSPPESPQNCPDDCHECGDGFCLFDETAESCPQDCHECGNGICEPVETWDSCPQDCWCGNGVCENPPENSAICPEDCPPDPTDGQWCGDGVCENGESLASCPDDCFDQCGDGVCDTDADMEYSCCDCNECEWDGGDWSEGGAIDDGTCGCRGDARGGAIGLFALLLARRRRRT